jgi:hypothetical protein
MQCNEHVDDAVMRWGSSVSLVCKSDRETTMCISKCLIERNTRSEPKKCLFVAKWKNYTSLKANARVCPIFGESSFPVSFN